MIGSTRGDEGGPPRDRLRVVHVIPDLGPGGAEQVLVHLLAGLDRDRFENRVVLLGDGDVGADRARAHGAVVAAMGLVPNRPDPRAVWRLRRTLVSWRPDVVQTWMYHANLVGGLAARSLRGTPTVWGLHQTDLPRGDIPWHTRAAARAGAHLSGRIPARIVCCAESTRREHVARGYAAGPMVVVPNGFPVSRLEPERRARARVALDLAADVPVLLRVGRFHPQKDHRSLLEAVADLRRRRPLVVLLCGTGVDPSNTILAGWVEELDLAETVRLLGPRDDVPTLHDAADVAISSSAFGEAHPLVLGEAMERARPVVATDVGDSAAMVGDAGRVVPPRDPRALTDALAGLLDADPDERETIGRRGRERIMTTYRVEQMVARYAEVYGAVARPTGRH